MIGVRGVGEGEDGADRKVVTIVSDASEVHRRMFGDSSELRTSHVSDGPERKI